jgi:hypothetical protein
MVRVKEKQSAVRSNRYIKIACTGISSSKREMVSVVSPKVMCGDYGRRVYIQQQHINRRWSARRQIKSNHFPRGNLASAALASTKSE